MSTKLQLLSSFLRICMVLLIFTAKGHTIDPAWRTSFFPSTSVCKSDECKEQGRRLADLINHSVDPCDDFYEYVCSKWAEKNPAPPNYDEWSIDSQLQIKTFEQVQVILEEPIKKEDSPDLKSAKIYHAECMRTSNFDIVEPSVIRNNVNPIGYFPLVHMQKYKHKTWQPIHNYYLSFTGESALFSIFWRGDRRNNNIPLLCIREVLSPYGLIKGVTLTGGQVESYHKFLAALVKEVMPSEVANIPQAYFEKGISAVIDFRMKLNKIVKQTTQASNLYHPMTVETMNDRYTQIVKKLKPTAQIDWIDTIHHFYRFRDTRYVTKNMTINVENRVYFNMLALLLSKTPGDVIANHNHLYFIERHTILNSHLRNMLMDVVIQKNKLKGKIRYLGSRSAMCIAMNEMKETIGKLYVRRYFSADDRKETNIIAKELKEMLRTNVQESTWLSNAMINMFTDRIADMNIVLGFPEYYKDRTKRFENPAAAAMDPISLEAFYLPSSNVLSISAGYLNPPIYSSSLPYAMRYSGLGEYIAHEMYHAFGPHATDYMQCTNPWPQMMTKKYDEKMLCFVNKFDKLPIQELNKMHPIPKIDGLKTLEENVSDLMGLKLAYWAFRRKVWETKKCEILPQMFSLTCDHLFFISFASLYCTTLTTDSYLLHLKDGAHATPRIRVNEATSNFEIFNELFRCTKREDTDNLQTCDLWK